MSQPDGLNSQMPPSRPCTYDSRTPVQPPTQRIRVLEDKLRHARALLHQLKGRTRGVLDNDIDAAIQDLDSEAIPIQDACLSIVDSSHNQQTINQSKRSGGRRRSGECFFGVSSGYSFICRILNIFLKDSESTSSTTNIQCAIRDLFDLPIPDQWKLQNYHQKPPSLPDRATSLRLLQSLFARCPLVAQFLRELDLRQMLDRIDQPGLPHWDSPSNQTLMLVHSVLALGYLYNVPLHRAKGCRSVTAEALEHFSAARYALDISQCSDLTSLQALLCNIIFLLSSSRIVAAHPYIGVACSSALRLGLRSRSFESIPLTQEQRQERKRTFATLLKLDLYTSLVLGLPPFIDLRSFDHNLSVFRSEDSIDVSHLEGDHRANAIRLELSLKHLEILKITAFGLEAVFLQPMVSTEATTSDFIFPVNLEGLEAVGDQLQAWARSFSSLLKCIGNSLEWELAKYELEMAYNFGQIVFYWPFLHDLRKVADGETLSRNQLHHALVCIKTSSITIRRSEEMMKRGLLCSASWISLYSIFLAVVCLSFLIAAHNGTSKPEEAWKKARSGIRLLCAARCQDNGSTACVEIVKRLVSELSHTVQLDIEEIESSTARLCQYSVLHDDQAEEFPWLGHLERRFSPMVYDSTRTSALRGHSVVSRLSPFSPEDSVIEAEGASENLTPRYQCDADEILAQAQEVSLA